MKFEEAVKASREGKKVFRRKIYEIYKSNAYIALSDDFLLPVKDILADDWEILEEKPTFTKEQIEYIKNMMDLCLDWYPLGLVKMPIIFAGTFKMKLDSLCE